MSNFIQLSLNFDIQERNWIRWAGGKAYLNHLYWNGCMTGRLQESTIQLSESASDTSDEVAVLDAYEFNILVGGGDKLRPHLGLPKQYRDVYLAHVFNKVVSRGSVENTKAGDIHHQCALLKISKYRYEKFLDLAIKMIKRQGGFE